MRILVTGSSGQVGSYVVDALRQRGDEPLGLDLRPSQWTDIVRDVRRLDDVPDVGAIVHCAAQVSVPRSVESPREDAANNIDGTLSVLDLARRLDARIVYISSAAVYGEKVLMPISESDAPNPMTPYGLSKLTGESYAMTYHRLYGLHVVSLRPFNIFSRRQDPANPYSGVISKFAAVLKARQPMRIHGDGGQTRDFVHVSDVVQAIRIGLDVAQTRGRILNVGTGLGTSVNQLASTMQDIAGLRQAPVHEASRIGDIRDSIANIGALRSLGYHPTTDLKTHLAEMFA